ncbi:uncharacterized protein [Montipora capricornis]|uniref:uncharacterized protein n=1 Tax=Montipora capricornis TaxID=246305 RepID=UPI0035F1E852
MEDCRSKILGKENILFDLPSPHPILGGGNDTNDVIIAAACAHQQVLMQDILSKTVERQIWRKVRSRDFWQTCRRNWDDGDFITNLRVDRGTFLLIVERLTPYIHRETTRMRQSIEVDKRVAVALWRNGSGDSARTIAWMFGVGESTCSEVCLEVAQSICEEFGQQFLGTPSHEDLKRQAQLFETGLGYPMCIGARDGSHIPIRGSFARRKILWCFKGFYSLVLQIVAGADYRILAATMGHAGNTHDSTIMKNHSFWKNREDIFPPGSRVIDGLRIPYLEIGDSAFKLTPRSMKPYTHNKLTDAQAYYNYRHSSARMVVEQTFGLLKGRFRILLFTNESSIPTVNAITMACCILHNICIVREVTFKYEWTLTFQPFLGGS